jgi:hypothetical protein
MKSHTWSNQTTFIQSNWANWWSAPSLNVFIQFLRVVTGSFAPVLITAKADNFVADYSIWLGLVIYSSSLNTIQQRAILLQIASASWYGWSTSTRVHKPHIATNTYTPCTQIIQFIALLYRNCFCQHHFDRRFLKRCWWFSPSLHIQIVGKNHFHCRFIIWIGSGPTV